MEGSIVVSWFLGQFSQTQTVPAGGFFSEKPIDENATKLQFHITSLVQGTATVGWNDCMLVDVLIRYVLLVN